MDIGTAELIVGALTVTFGPAGAQAMLIKAKLNGHLEKITDIHGTVGEIKVLVDSAKDERHDLDKRITLVEAKQSTEVAS